MVDTDSDMGSCRFVGGMKTGLENVTWNMKSLYDFSLFIADKTE